MAHSARNSTRTYGPPVNLAELEKAVWPRRRGLGRLLDCLAAGISRPRVEDAGGDGVGEGRCLTDLEDDGRECGRPRGFGDLPEHLLELIFRNLAGSRRQYHFAICGVNRTWRRLGRALFFSAPWQVPHLICHPSQLFCLSPRPVSGSRTGLLKCFVRRESKPPGGGGTRFTFYIGRDHRAQHRARFLFCAVQASRSEVLVYLNSRAEGRPVGQLAANGFATHYRLELSGVALVPSAGSSSGGSAVAAGHSSQPAPLPHALSWDPAEAAAAAAAAAGEGLSVFAELQYKARVKGFMQPRRMRVLLPDPSQLSFQQGLPQLARMPTAATRPSLSFSRASGALVGAVTHSRSGSDAAEELEGASTPRCSQQALPDGISPSTPGSVGLPASATADAGKACSGGQQQQQQQQQQQPCGSTRVGRLLLRLGLGEAVTMGGACSSASAAGLAPAAAAGHDLAPAVSERPLELPRRPPQPVLSVGLRNKAPHWNDGLRCWCLNFRGRVKLASVKNFQLTREDDPNERVVMQFGKVAANTYILDFNPTVLTAFQAFAICLSTFDSKIML